MNTQDKKIKIEKMLDNISIVLIFLSGILSPEITLVIQLGLIIVFFNKIKINRSFFVMIFLIMIHGIINILIENNTIILMFKQIIGIVISFTFYYNIIDRKQDVNEIFKKYMFFSKYIAIYAIIQQIAYTFNISAIYDMRWIVKEQLLSINSIYRSVAIFREPSELALILFPAVFLSIYCFIGRYKERLCDVINKRISLIIIIGFIFTFSSSGYIGIFIGCILIWLEYKHTIRQFFILFTVIAAFFALYNVVPEFKLRLDDTISLLEDYSDIEKSNISSQTIIINMNIAKESLLNTIGFGSGIGSHTISYDKYINNFQLNNVIFFLNKEDANSLLIRIISEFGYIGIIILIIFFYKNKNNEKNTIYNIYSKTCLCYFLLRFLRYGHYFNNGLWMFVVIYIILSRKNEGEK